MDSATIRHATLHRVWNRADFLKIMTIKVIDLFSGPGGLGEGFAAAEDGDAFRISVSAEMETSAHSTLTMRAFYRLAKS